MSHLDPQPPERPDPAAGSGPARDPEDPADQHPPNPSTANPSTANQSTANQSTDLTVVLPAVLDDTAEMPPVVDPPAVNRATADPAVPDPMAAPDPMIEDPVIADLATARPSPPHRPVPPPPPEPPAAPRRPAADRTRRARLSLLGAGAVVVIALLGLLVRAVGGGDAGDGTPGSAATVKVPAATITAAASSTQDPEGGVDYVAANTLDGDPATAWNSDGRKDGSGPGISLTYTFAAPLDLRGITILNGYQKRSGSADLWRLNERLREVRVVTDAGAWTWTLADTREPQTFRRDLGRTGAVRLEVVSIYQSEAYRDIGVSEVSFTAAG